MSIYNKPHQIVRIDTRNRVDGSHTDFTYKLNLRPNIRYNKCVLLKASIPKTQYTVQDNGRNYFKISELGVETTITIPEGFYTRRNIAYTLNTLIAASAASWTYAITYDNNPDLKDRGKFIWTVSGNGGNYPTLIFDYETPYIGFDAGSYVFTSSQYISPRVMNLASLSNAYFLHSNVMQSTGDTVFATILGGDIPGMSYISFVENNPDYTAVDFNYSDSNLYSFVLTDEVGVSISTEGNACLFSICFFVSD